MGRHYPRDFPPGALNFDEGMNANDVPRPDGRYVLFSDYEALCVKSGLTQDEYAKFYAAQDELKALKAQLTALEADAGEYVVKLIEANDRSGQSPNPNERADWVGTCCHAYAAMSFLKEARAALSNAGEGKEWK